MENKTIMMIAAAIIAVIGVFFFGFWLSFGLEKAAGFTFFGVLGCGMATAMLLNPTGEMSQQVAEKKDRHL